MAMQFGKTWWGEHWLRSLQNVDYDNRLPRGASYARHGSVQNVKFKDNTINAKVSGSRSTPYRVNLIVPPFFEEQVGLLMAEIIKHPALIAKLLNRELDPAMMGIAEKVGLKVFPQQWTDFKMQCSCPDWAVPCKHLAAVIYMVSREIDNNPFLVFEMHKVNLIAELKKRGIFVVDPKKAEIPRFSGLLKTIGKTKNYQNYQNYDEDNVYDRVDFSTLHDISEALVKLLPDAPPFYAAGNFRENFTTQFLHNAKTAKRILNRKLDFETIFPIPSDAPEINPDTSGISLDTLEINKRTTLAFSIDSDGTLSISEKNHSLTSLIAAVFHLNPDHLLDYQPSVVAFHKIVFAALHLIANGNVVPQIVQLANKQFVIRWLPALIDSAVRQLVEKLNTILAPDLLLSSRKPLVNQTNELLSVVITRLMVGLSRPARGDLFEDIFFKNRAYLFAGVGEKALSGGIKVWLDRFYLSTEEYKPVITVSELSEFDSKLPELPEFDDTQFDVQISVEGIASEENLPVEISKILQEKQYEQQRFKILQTLSLLSPFIRGLDEHINSTGNIPVLFSAKEFAPFLMEVLPAIRLLDIKIMLPRSLQELLYPRPTLKLKQSNDGRTSIKLNDLLSFDWQVAIGDTVISPEEFAKLMKNASGLFRFKENYIYVNEAEMEKLHKLFSSDKQLDSYRLLQAALAEEYEGAPVTLTPEIRELINKFIANEDIPLPQGLNAQLRPYQQRGYSWMYRNSMIGFGSVIADDMGLGKTLQVISILLKFKEEGALRSMQSALVIVPTSLLTNWLLEIEKFAPSLTAHIYHGQNRKIEHFNADIMLTTYGVLRSDVELLRKHKWQAVIIDEAQNIKNQDALQAKAVKSIPANVRIAMSGTPVENRLTEFWSIMDFTNKGYLGNLKTFKTDFAEPIQVFNDAQVVSRFRKITSPFMMRRMKSDKSIISDLPDKVEQNQFALLTKQQAALYEKTMRAALAEIEGICGPDPQSLFKRQGLVLQMILALKQICNHPTNFLKNGNFDSTLSGKVELLFELLNSIVDAGEKVLIFTQFKEMGTLLERFIAEKFGEQPLFYHGGCSIKQRQEMVERFQHNRADKIFILSLKAAGTGLNLTAAAHVIHFDLWWNPAVENQATDRAYRIGQKKNVMVHRLITKNTFEERIDEMIQKKKHLAELTVATGENWIGKLSNKELREIFG